MRQRNVDGDLAVFVPTAPGTHAGLLGVRLLPSKVHVEHLNGREMSAGERVEVSQSHVFPLLVEGALWDLCGASRGGFGPGGRVRAYLAPEVLVGRHPSPRLARGRGAERSLKTRAEAALREELGRIHNSWSLTELEDAANRYQHDLCDEHFHLDRVDPKGRYNVSTITVPVFLNNKLPVMCFVAGSFDKPISGHQVEEMAVRIKASADRITSLASGHEDIS